MTEKQKLLNEIHMKLFEEGAIPAGLDASRVRAFVERFLDTSEEDREAWFEGVVLSSLDGTSSGDLAEELTGWILEGGECWREKSTLEQILHVLNFHDSWFEDESFHGDEGIVGFLRGLG